jgi:proteic killer suppression protein
MIKSFRHKGLEAFFKTGSKAGIQPAHGPKLRRILGVLDQARGPHQMNLPGFKLHPLGGDLEGFWSVWVSGNWRVIFQFDSEDAELVDYLDYH